MAADCKRNVIKTTPPSPSEEVDWAQPQTNCATVRLGRPRDSDWIQPQESDRAKQLGGEDGQYLQSSYLESESRSDPSFTAKYVDKSFLPVFTLIAPTQENIHTSEASALTALFFFQSDDKKREEEKEESASNLHPTVPFFFFLSHISRFFALTWWSNSRRWGSGWRQRCPSRRWPCRCWGAGPGRRWAAWCTTCWSKPVPDHRSTLNKARGNTRNTFYRDVKETKGSHTKVFHM